MSMSTKVNYKFMWQPKSSKKKKKLSLVL